MDLQFKGANLEKIFSAFNIEQMSSQNSTSRCIQVNGGSYPMNLTDNEDRASRS